MAMNISDLREICAIFDCEVKYYKDFDFVDIFEKTDLMASIARKKSTEFSNIDNNAYSIGYLKNDFLIRLDEIGDSTIPSETYLVWDGTRLQEAHRYYTGAMFGKQVTNEPMLHDSWIYEYTDDRLIKVTWLCHEDKTFGYADAMSVTYTYEYDSKGLSFIRKTFQGKNWIKPETYVAYDREEENFMKSYTVSKTALISADAKTNDGVVDFENTGKYKTKKCPVCGGDMAYIMTVDLEAKKLHRKVSPLTKFPVLHCFGCESEQRYRLNELNTAISGMPYIKDAAFRFKRKIDEDEMAEAFIAVGGRPIWIQDDNHPICKECGKPMVYVMRIQSWEEKTNGKHHLMFGDEGSLYVFACCGNIATLPQWS